jgi:hypothetical protein
MKAFIVIAVSLIADIASVQSLSLTSSVPSAPLPTIPAGSQPDVATLINNIPACWAPCVGGAIKQVCPSSDTWTCACNDYFNTSAPDFIQIADYDTACQNCPQNVGPSDGSEQGTL